MNVPNRKHILFHWGNTLEDTQGCILIGQSFSEDLLSIQKSKLAFQEFMAALQLKATITLHIEGTE